MANGRWAAADMPPQAGRTAIVTGATSGVGFEAALALARTGAATVLAARDAEKAQRAIAAIRRSVPEAVLEFRHLDTADLASVRAFAASWRGASRRIDILLLNAGVAWLPQRLRSADGFELQLAANYLGHFALTGLLRANLAPDARIVPVASLGHRRGRLHFDDLQFERSYSPSGAYRQSKLAMLMFGLELDRRLRAAGSAARAIPAHPGWAATDIFRRGGQASGLQRFTGWAVFSLIGQSSARGALPLLYAATAPQARGGVYYGPDGRGEIAGHPAEARIEPHARDTLAASRLWSISEALTGVDGG